MLTLYSEGAHKSGPKNCLLRTLPGQLAAASGDSLSAVKTYLRNKKNSNPSSNPPQSRRLEHSHPA